MTSKQILKMAKEFKEALAAKGFNPTGGASGITFNGSPLTKESMMATFDKVIQNETEIKSKSTK